MLSKPYAVSVEEKTPAAGAVLRARASCSDRPEETVKYVPYHTQIDAQVT
jgi:hypothetical protein